ncbi:alginate O-acetyltransferase complex protein AlgI [Kordia periserrulae]|uniref:Alginate O-acetyltransferase complex protein AlgI n=1 Tax=Kordia periserrulae TaxID=701523 RepID=A0A2T6C3R0_9FLAO|nr:alginate O-acetyltransferase complex protein AlgI [Kordia periserrulae]
MVFSSYFFTFYFLPIVLLLYYVSPKKLRHFTLTIISYIFYGWANSAFVLLMLGSTIIDYICGLFIAERWGKNWSKPIESLEKGGKRTQQQKWAVTISVISNLSLLAFFKYFNFAVENYNALLEFIGLEGIDSNSIMNVVLPLGISFYTFQSMSYSIDIYRGNAKPIRNFIDFACYVSMFPQLVAGPIIRFQDVANQLRHRTHTLEKFSRGIAFFCLGMAKKVLLANPCGKIADTCFDAVDVGFLNSWYGAISYAFQIYFDFSGYSDMAIGLGLMLGFVFAKNFDNPYSSKSITEFWRRWHISLSTWLRDYLYIPLGGNRNGNTRTYINLMLVMLLGGLWHGSSWNFVIWGAIHGVFLALERLANKKAFYQKLPKIGGIMLTFIIVVCAWVFFRASDLPNAINYLQAMFGGTSAMEIDAVNDILIKNPYYIINFILAGIVVWTFPQTWNFTKNITFAKSLWIIFVMIISILTLMTQDFNPFIYFIF